MLNWKKTVLALSNLESLLTCKICNNLVNDPCSLKACDHYFCRNCVEGLVGVNSKCPECGAFAWSRDLQPSRHLASIVSLCCSMRNIVGKNSPTSTAHDKELHPTNKARSIDLKEKTYKSDNVQQLLSEKDINNADVITDLSSCSTRESEDDQDIISSVELFSTSDTSLSERSLTSLEYTSDDCAEKCNIPSNLDMKDKLFIPFNELTTVSKITPQSSIPLSLIEIDINLNTGRENVKQKDHKRKRPSSGNGSEDEDIFHGTSSVTTLTQQPQQTVSDKENNEIRITPKCKVFESQEEFLPRITRNPANVMSTPKSLASTDKAKRGNCHLSMPTEMEIPSALLSKRNKRGEGLLHIAAIKGYIDQVKTLLERGADPNARDNAGWSPLHEACNHGHTTIASILLDHGAIIDLPGGLDHFTPLHDAVANNKLEVARVLVERGAPLGARNRQGMTPMDCAVTDAMKKILVDSLPVRECAFTVNKETIQKSPLPCGTSFGHVLLYTGLNTEQKEMLEYCTSILGGKVVKEFSIDVTHIVTKTSEKGFCPRTMKYLFGVLSGKWIITFAWISKCLSIETWVSENAYEVKGTITANKDIPNHARNNALKKLPGLFDGCKFFFSGTFDPQTPSKENLIQLVKYGGGNVLSREPKSDLVDYHLVSPSRDNKDLALSVHSTVAYHARPDSAQYRCTTYIIYDPLCLNKPLTKEVQLFVAPVSWLLDCVSNYKILDIHCASQ